MIPTDESVGYCHPSAARTPELLAGKIPLEHNYRKAMKNKYQVVPQTATTKKPAKAQVSDAEFRRRLKNISEWRKKRLAQLRACA